MNMRCKFINATFLKKSKYHYRLTVALLLLRLLQLWEQILKIR